MKMIAMICLLATTVMAADKVDLKVSSLDMKSPLVFDDSFGSGAAFNQVRFTLENKSSEAVKVLALFSVTAVDKKGKAISDTLTASTGYMLLTAKQKAKWNMANSIPVLHGEGDYEVEVCVKPYTPGMTLVEIKDKKKSNNCESGVFTFKRM
jgi:hypothetical protein